MNTILTTKYGDKIFIEIVSKDYQENVKQEIIQEVKNFHQKVGSKEICLYDPDYNCQGWIGAMREQILLLNKALPNPIDDR